MSQTYENHDKILFVWRKNNRSSVFKFRVLLVLESWVYDWRAPVFPGLPWFWPLSFSPGFWSAGFPPTAVKGRVGRCCAFRHSFETHPRKDPTRLGRRAGEFNNSTENLKKTPNKTRATRWQDKLTFWKYRV